MSLDASIIGPSEVKDFAFVHRYNELVKEEGKITKTFPEAVEKARKLGNDIYAKVQEYQRQQHGVKPDQSALIVQLQAFQKTLWEVKIKERGGQAEEITKLLKKVQSEHNSMSVPTPFAEHTFEVLANLDSMVAAQLYSAFETAAKYNEKYVEWEQALTRLQQKITTHIEYAEKLHGILGCIWYNDGKPTRAVAGLVV